MEWVVGFFFTGLLFLALFFLIVYAICSYLIGKLMSPLQMLWRAFKEENKKNLAKSEDI